MRIFVTLFMMSLFLYTSANACPILNGVDLADGDNQDPSFIEFDSQSVTLTADEFKAVPAFVSADYGYCKEALVLKKLVTKETGEVFYALLTVADRCDGGNSDGALMSGDLKQIVGKIGDSYIYCMATPVALDLSSKILK